MFFGLGRCCSLRNYSPFVLFCAIIVGFSLNFLILFIFYSFDHEPIRERPKFCSRKLITEHFMFNESVTNFISHGPVQPEFSYKISNENLCSFNKSPDVLLFVLSKSSNFESRQAIRRTWANLHVLQSQPEYENLQIKILFFLDIDETNLMRIEMEEKIFNDIVQVHLPQDYLLSTLRDMATLHWTETFCPNVQLTMKTDDDVFLNIFLFANVIKQILRKFPKKNLTDFQCEKTKFNDRSAMMFGIQIVEGRVVRFNYDSSSATARYIVTDDEYPCETYPTYLSGFGYIVNQQARRNLLCAFFRTERVFPISDVFITGILAEYLSIRRRSLPLMIHSRINDNCRTFFNNRFAFVCATASHHLAKSSNENVNLFELFSSYWNVLIDHFDLYQVRLVFRRL